MKLLDYINELKGAVRQSKINVSDDVIFSEACSFKRQDLIPKKDFNKVSNKPVIQKDITKEVPPTPSQINVLKKYNLPIPKTKSEAAQIIKKSMENN